MRLQKFMAQAGIASRRKAEELIQAGKVLVNGVAVTKLGTTIDPFHDVVEYEGNVLKPVAEKIYLALHKPAGYITSRSEEQGKTIFDLIKTKQRLFPVGRLDKESSGLLLLTNDGDFTQRVTHAKYGCEKEYFISLDNDLTPPHIRLLERGMRLGSQHAAPVKVISARNKSARIILTQGLNRQIRRSLGKLGYTVVKLKRIRIGKLELGELASGQSKPISPHQVI